jgi:predicted dehydrogenase
MRIGMIGCGYVADFYMRSLAAHPQLELVGVFDSNEARLRQFSRFYGVRAYASYEALLADGRVELVVNLTNPRAHYRVSRTALEAGKHVYTEKPLATNFAEACELVELAERRGLGLSSAPCNVLGETAQTVWRALADNAIGPVRLVYAELDDGLVHRMPYRKWLSDSGAPWPYKDEFEVGCTLEHAGYYVSWLAAFFGPVDTVTAFSSVQIADKQTDLPLEVCTPDFAVACLRFSSGLVARLTCSIVASHGHTLRIFGDDGVLSVRDCWDYRAPVYIHRPITIRRRVLYPPWKRKYPLVSSGRALQRSRGSSRMDWFRGVAEMAAAITERRPCRLSPLFSLHVNEIVLAMQNAGISGSTYRLTTTFEPMRPMPWAGFQPPRDVAGGPRDHRP